MVHPIGYRRILICGIVVLMLLGAAVALGGCKATSEGSADGDTVAVENTVEETLDFIAADQEPAGAAEQAALLAAAEQANLLAEGGQSGLNSFDTVDSASFAADPQTHRVSIMVFTQTDQVDAGIAVGEDAARLFDTCVQFYLAAVEGIPEDDEAALNDALQANAPTAEDIAAAWDLDGESTDSLGQLYTTYDLYITADNLENTLDLDGYRPAGTDTKMTWQ